MRRRWRKIAALAASALVAGSAAACLPPPPTGQPEEAAAGEQGGAPALWAGQPVAEVYAEGEVRGFEYRQAGQVIGRSYGRYLGPVTRDGVTLYRFASKLERTEDPAAAGGLDPEALRGQGELWLDAQGKVARAWERSEAAELRLSLEADTLEAEAITGVPRDESWSHPVDPGAGAMGYMSAYYEELMFAIRPLAAGDLSWPLISLSTGSVDRWEGRVQLGAEGLEIRTSLGERVVFDAGRVRSIRVEDIQLEVVPIEDAQWPSWEIEAPKKLAYAPGPNASFTRRPVELAGRPEDPRLAGELVIPNGEGPFPAVVMLSGSAASDRHGFAGPPAVDLGYHELGDALAEAGFVVIRFDDRGVGESAFAPASWRGEVEDARRALRTLLIQPEVDPDRVLVIGHGEGGWRGLVLSAEYPKSVRGVAALGTPGRSYKRVVGATQPKVLEAIERGSALPTILEANRDWYREIMEVDLEALVAKGKAPLWVVFGEADFEFEPELEVPAWKELAKATGRAQALTRYPGLDHLLKPSTPGSTAASYQKARVVDPGFLAALVAWARERVAP